MTETDDTAEQVDVAPARRRIDWRDVVAVGLIVAAIALPLRGLLRYQGPAMEEGFMLTFPQEVLRGAIPNRDFLHLYGPGSLWALAGAFKVFGASLATERFFGLAQHVGIVFGVFALARPWGRRLAVVGAATALVVTLPPVGLTAMAWNGAVALGVWGLWTALGFYRHRRAAAPSDEVVGDRQRRALFIGGLLCGFALLFRPDLALAIGLGMFAVLWGSWRRAWRPLILGLVVGFVPMVVQVILAGPGHALVGMVIEPVFKLRGGRSLPVPPPWGHVEGFLQVAATLQRPGWSPPAIAPAHQIFLWFVLNPLVAFAIATVGVWRLRQSPMSLRARTLLVGGAFCIGMLGQGIQRPDTAHFAWVSSVSLGLLPLAVAEVVVHWRAAHKRAARRITLGQVCGAVSVALILAVAIPYFTIRSYVDLSGQTFDHNVFGTSVNHAGRNFYYGSPDVAEAANALIADFDRQHPKAGQRLFVGPIDLRRTPYSDAFFYFLFPKLVPATYYIEMDPFDSKPGTRLASDVGSADWLILSGVWSNWEEPNDSRLYGSDKPNQVVRDHFCLLGSYGSKSGSSLPYFELWKRCR
ncbi:MAG: hypothetical protein ABI276_05590 [Acidimicrobiales bacterium]